MPIFRTPVGPAERLQMKLVQGQKLPGIGSLLRIIVKFRGVQIPPNTFTIRPHLPHIGPIVVHEKTRFGKNVTVFHNVTIGRANIWEEPEPGFAGFEIQDYAILCAGAVIVGSNGVITVGEGTVLGANAVLNQSTGDWEIWAGSPARKVGDRSPITIG